MQKLFIYSLLSVFLAILIVPNQIEASYRGDVSAWLPWWSDTEGLKSATENIEKLDVIYPFVYEIDATGKIVDKADLSEKQWRDFLKLAKKEHVDIIPSIAWFEGQQIDVILGDRKKRDNLIDDIVELVDDNDFDGINIDFEQKKSDTIDNFSLFLKDLKKELGRDELTCAIEARTPAKDLYKTIPNPLKYANDYAAINKYCDEIQLMTYDQQRADLTLNDIRKGVPYMPVADDAWVEKVVDMALEDFDNDKVVLGVATYGRAWDITVAPEWYRDYTKVATLNEPRILELAEKYDSPIGRSAGGEAIMSYFPEDSVYKIFNQLPTPEGTPKGYEAAAKALLVATYAKVDIPVRFVTWSDSVAAENKLKIAEKHDLKGLAFFKIDGEESQDIWDLF